MTLGEKLKEARKQANLSQEQLAEALCISRSAVAKWETDLGIPDIDNLRAIAEHLEISVESLLDHTQSLQEARQPATVATYPYCGKNCAQCDIREELACQGCKNTNHHSKTGCAIARCCQSKNLIACAFCSYHETCGALGRCNSIPAQRLQQKRQQEALQQRIAARKQEKKEWILAHAPRMGKWLYTMFLLNMAAIVLGLAKAIAGDSLAFVLLNLLYSLLYTFCILQLSPAREDYRKAALFSFAAVPFALGVDLLELYLPGTYWQFLPLLAVTGFSLYAQYHLLHSHSAVTADFDSTLSQRWLTLWKWNIGILLAAPLMIVFALIPVLGWIAAGLMVAALPFVSLGVTIFEFFQLYRTAQLFRENTVEYLCSRIAAAESRY